MMVFYEHIPCSVFEHGVIIIGVNYFSKVCSSRFH